MNTEPNSSTRRTFIKSSAAAATVVAAAPFMISSRGHAANADTLKIGLIGCGGRGTGAASQALTADPNVVLTAMGDVFPEKIESSLGQLQNNEDFGARVKVDPEHRFAGLDAFQNVIESGVDVVLLTTPPGFRPQHLKAAVDAGKHIFCEKPMATDSPGLRSVMESAAKANLNKTALVAGFCWRYDPPRRELYKRIHAGEIGEIRSVYATYYTGPVKPMPEDSARPKGMGDVEWQLRNWYNFTWLSGDGLVEQACHSVDKIAWALRDEHPIKAVATGGRVIPNNSGNIFDSFAIYYEYESGLRTYMGSRQIPGCHNENNDYIHGTKGTASIESGRVSIKGETNWRFRGDAENMYQVEHNELFASIRKGEPINDGDRMSTSTMTALMGRMAAYTGQEITWEQALNSEERLVPENLTWDMPLPIRPMAVPGQHKLA